MIDLIVTFIIITKNRPRKVKRLIDSILKAELKSSSLVLIDDSDFSNFSKTKDFLESLAVPFIQLSSLQAQKQVQETLEKTDLISDEKRFIENCTGLRSPFSGYVERFFERNKLKLGLSSGEQWFAPYSATRNLGIFCSMKFFNPDSIFFLDDDCIILHPRRLKSQLLLMDTKSTQKKIVAMAGVYKDLIIFEPKETSEFRISSKALKILRGMDSFLRTSLTAENERFKAMPPHMLGGVLVLSKKVFYNLPFDPYVARGEDHAYAWDLKNCLSEKEIAIRDNHFVVGHQKELSSQSNIDTNVLRDIFRFVYVRAKTGNSFIPLFMFRWILASLIQSFIRPSKYLQCEKEFRALVFFAPRFAKENAFRFRQNYKAWNNFLEQVF